VATIALHAGVSKGLVFHFFDNKQALFSAVVEDSLEQWSLLSDYRASEGDDSAREELKRLFLTSFEFVEQHPILSLFSHSKDQRMSAYRSEFSKMNKRWRRRIEKSLKRGIDRGEVDPELDTARTAAIFHELQTALIRGASVSEQNATFDYRTVQLAIDLLLKGISRR
jgi:AcrR family transcriptional regulator